MTSKEYWDNRAVKRLIEAEKQSNDYIKKVKKIYSKANDDIKKELANVYKNYSKETGIDVHTLKIMLSKEETDEFWKTLKGQGLKKYVQANYKARINRLEQIQGQLYAKAKEIYKDELNTVYGHYRSVINESYNKTIYDTQIGTGYDFTFNKLDDKMIETVLNTKWYGGNYSSRIWGNTDILANRVSETIGGALISGKPYYKTANEIADTFGVAQYYAERLVRTETNHFNAEAEALAYKELGVEKYVFVATLDSRTSKMCQEHDGKVYDFKDKETGVNYPPLHPNCRSTTRGYLGEEEEKALKRRARDPITGKTEIIDNISYKDWVSKISNQNGSKEYLINTYDNYKAVNEKLSIKQAMNNLPLEHRKIVENVKFKVVRTGNSCYNRKEDTIYILKGSNKFEVLHEIGHSLETKLDIYNNSEFIKILEENIDLYAMDTIKEDNTFTEIIEIIENKKFISKYQGRIYDNDMYGNSRIDYKNGKINIKSLGEYFSEGYREYFQNPENLKEKDIKLYNFIKEL